MLCQCGCGALAPIAKQTEHARGYVAGQPVRFLPGHNQRLRKRAGTSYFQQYHGRRVTYAHVVIAERVLGKPMPVGSEVHHVDENKRNNAHANLVICQDKAYHKLLHVRARILRMGGNPNTQKYCGACKRVKNLDCFHVMRANKSNGRQSMCSECVVARDAARRG